MSPALSSSSGHLLGLNYGQATTTATLTEKSIKSAVRVEATSPELIFDRLYDLSLDQVIAYITDHADWLAEQVKAGDNPIAKLVAKMPEFAENLSDQPVGKIARVLVDQAKTLAATLTAEGIVDPDTAASLGNTLDEWVKKYGKGHLAAMSAGAFLILLLLLIVIFKVVL